MDISKLILLIGFYAVVIYSGIKYFKNDKYQNKNIFEYVFMFVAFLLGTLVAYQYYTEIFPIAFWSLVSGGIAAVMVEARRKKTKNK
jgi:hypothetical protein